MTLRESKQIIRAYMRDFYTDEHLASALDRARAGTLRHYSPSDEGPCMCFAGLVHPEGFYNAWKWATAPDYERVRSASDAYRDLGLSSCWYGNALRQRRLIPMLCAEIRRRERARDTIIEREVLDEASPGLVPK